MGKAYVRPINSRRRCDNGRMDVTLNRAINDLQGTFGEIEQSWRQRKSAKWDNGSQAKWSIFRSAARPKRAADRPRTAL